MERTKETLKELIRAGRAKVPAHKVIKGGHYASVTIEHQHTNITHIEKNGEVILDRSGRGCRRLHWIRDRDH